LGEDGFDATVVDDTWPAMCYVCTDHLLQILRGYIRLCRSATVMAPTGTRFSSGKWTHLCGIRGCGNPTILNIRCGGVQRDRQEPPVVARIGNPKGTAVKGSTGLGVDLTKDQLQEVVKALHSAIDKEKDEGKKYDLALIVERFINLQELT